MGQELECDGSCQLESCAGGAHPRLCAALRNGSVLTRGKRDTLLDEAAVEAAAGRQRRGGYLFSAQNRKKAQASPADPLQAADQFLGGPMVYTCTQ